MFDIEAQYQCANCGQTGNLYTLEEAARSCGTGYGEWYCIEGEGCNDSSETQNTETKGKTE